jgi:thiol-disulfide isomerase/thioredoxin
MNMTIELHNHRLRNTLCATAVALGVAFSTQTTHGAVATNFTIVNHATGQPLSLYDYRGSIILLDFWAYWCGPCLSAASDIEPNITRYYRNAGGNANGVPVQVISVNIDCSNITQENLCIQARGMELVADDCNWIAYTQWDNGGIPQFAVINGTTNSSNYAAWQVLWSPTGYGTNYTVPTMKSYIDSVQTPAPISTVTNPVSGAVIAPSNIPLKANIVTNGKIIKRVEYYNGTTLLGTTTNAPYSLTWSNVSVGAKSVTARAYYGTSSSVTSTPVSFTVATPVATKLTRQGTNLLLSWTGGAGNFQVQVATNLVSPVWQNYGTAGPGTSQVITCSNRAAFYRVRWP